MNALRPMIVLAVLLPAVAAQDVTVNIKGDTLIIKGSAGVDSLTVGTAVKLADGSGPVPVDVIVNPTNDTTVNGSSGPGLFVGVNAIKISLGGDSDVLDVVQLIAPGVPLTVIGGAGSDQIQVTDSTFGDFKYVGGSGNDFLNISNAALDTTKLTDTSGPTFMTVINADFGALTVKTGALPDALTCLDSTVTGNLVVSVGGEHDILSFSDLTVGAEALLKLGAGSDSVVMDTAAIGASLDLAAGADDDSIAILDAVVGAGMDIKLGGGANILSLTAHQAPLVVGTSITVQGGSDTDEISLIENSVGDTLTIAQDLVLLLKSGANELHQSGDVTIGNDLRLTAGALADQIDCDGLGVTHDAVFLLGAGTNNVVLKDCLIGNNLVITAGKDEDQVQLTGTTEVGGEEIIDLGGGET